MTDLRGVETHGVSNMLRVYVRDYKAGKLDPRPGWRIVRQSPGTAVIDAERRLGIIVGPKAMRLAIDKAKQVGVGVVTVFNSGHFGAIGHYAMQAAQHDMVGVCFTAAGLAWCPPSREAAVGTNPIASPPPRATRRRCSSTPRPPRSPATRSASRSASARRSCPAGSRTRTARRSWRRSPSSTATSSSRRRWAVRASRARTRATASR